MPLVGTTGAGLPENSRTGLEFFVDQKRSTFAGKRAQLESANPPCNGGFSLPTYFRVSPQRKVHINRRHNHGRAIQQNRSIRPLLHSIHCRRISMALTT
jgi:hypothetical protein